MRLRSVLRSIAILVGIVVAFYVMLWGVLILFTCLVPGPKMPTDAALAQQYYTNQAAFAELKEMLTTSTSVVGTGTNDADVGAQKRLRCDELLRQTKVLKVIHDGPELRFLVAASGFASKGYRIAILWRDTKPDHIIANLDDFRKTTAGEWDQAYRPLGDNWYLWIIW